MINIRERFTRRQPLSPEQIEAAVQIKKEADQKRLEEDISFGARYRVVGFTEELKKNMFQNLEDKSPLLSESDFMTNLEIFPRILQYTYTNLDKSEYARVVRLVVAAAGKELKLSINRTDSRIHNSFGRIVRRSIFWGIAETEKANGSEIDVAWAGEIAAKGSRMQMTDEDWSQYVNNPPSQPEA